jgi:uncharacterized DUF497 family protein
VQYPIDLSRLTGFEWDAGNDTKSEHKHSVSSAEAEQTFFNQPTVLAPAKTIGGESRLMLLGQTNAGRLLTVVFTVRGTLIRVISARPMGRKHRRIYGQA